MVHPVLGTLEKLGEVDIPARVLVETLLTTFVREVYGTRRKDIIRLILSEGPRFPAIAEFYYREVVGRVLAIVRPILRRAAGRCARALSAAHRRADAGRHRVARAVRQVRASRCRRDGEGACRNFVW